MLLQVSNTPVQAGRLNSALRAFFSSSAQSQQSKNPSMRCQVFDLVSETSILESQRERLFVAVAALKVSTIGSQAHYPLYILVVNRPGHYRVGPLYLLSKLNSRVFHECAI